MLFCRLTSYQRRLYAEFLESTEVKSVLSRTMRAFRAIGILRKLCNHPDLVCRFGDSVVTRYGVGVPQDLVMEERVASWAVIAYLNCGVPLTCPRFLIARPSSCILSVKYILVSRTVTYRKTLAFSFLHFPGWLLTRFGARPAKKARRAEMIWRTVRRMTTRIKFGDQGNSLFCSKYYRCGTSR